MTLPVYYSVAEVAEHFAVSERSLREQVRRIGCCRVIGRKIFLTDEDVGVLLEAWRIKPEPNLSPHTQLRHRTHSDTTQRALDYMAQLQNRGNPKGRMR